MFAYCPSLLKQIREVSVYYIPLQDLPNYFSDVRRDKIANKLLGVVINGATFLDGGNDRGEIVVSKDHLCGKLSRSTNTPYG